MTRTRSASPRPDSRRRERRPRSASTAPASPLKTTEKQRGGVTGRGFLPGQSGNPGGRPRSEKKLLERMYGENGEQLYRDLDVIRLSPKTHPKLKVQIARFLIERLHGRPQTRVEVEGGASLVELLAAAAARGKE
jgi:hypothetical protein